MILKNGVIVCLFSVNADKYEIKMGRLRFSTPCLQITVGSMRRAVYFAFLIVLFFKSSFQQQQPLNSSTELTALLNLRSSLGLRSRDWPRKADPCLIWNGISCQNGRVIGINISGFRRTRIGSQNPQFVVDSLANLTLLQSFNASKFLLPGEIPDWLGLRLRSMQVLDLSFCSLIGAIPASLANSTRRLYLSNNGLTGPITASLGQLLHLSVLDLANNLLIGSIPFSLTLLRNLTLLDLSSNQLSGIIPPGIGTLSNLQYLNFSRNSLSSSLTAELGDLENLADLDLSFNYFSGSVPPDFVGLRNLQRMDLGNNLIGGSLSENVFTDLKHLQFLVLKNNAFTGFVPDLLWSMPDLLLLDISGNNFTGKFTSSSLNLTITSATLNISNNLFYGSLAPLFRRFRVVDLSRNYFEGKVPDYLPTNESLLQNNCLQNLINQRTFVDCSSFYAERGLTFDNFGQTNSTIFPTAKTSGKSKNKLIILVTVFGGLALIILIALLLLLVLRKHKIGASNQREVGVGQVTSAGDEPLPGVSINFLNLGDSFTYQHILQATNGFSDSNLIKHGHSGDLFRGVLENGTKVVVKRVDLQLVKKETYLLELDLFSKVLNLRLVPLLGHCLENENEKFLVYKHMLNGDLSNALRKQADGNDENLHYLDWIKRMKIALGTAEGLSFLHNECSPPLVHRDVQASSILLDDKFEVRLGSLSELCAQEGDTHQNVITRLMRLPQSTEQGSSGSLMSACSYDVYCFGKVLLELVTGKVGISSSGYAQIKESLDQILPYISIYDKELVTKIVDPSLILDEDFLEEVWAIAVVAKSCLNPKPSRRPLMRYVLKAVENPVKVVREESDSSARLRTASSRGSWNFSLFGSWRHSFSELTNVPASRQAGASFKCSGTSGSQGSAQNNGGSSHRRQSKEIFPEPSDERDVARSGKGSKMMMMMMIL